jgi:phosphoribosylaminoimidazolecarboxamide formyltransferase/IMP cyclohydrolase
MAGQVKDIFTEVVVAPGFEDAALDILCGSKNVRLLRCQPPLGPGAERRTGAGGSGGSPPRASTGSRPPEWRQVDGGLLLQAPDQIDAAGDDPASWELKTGQPASADTLADLAFAWRAIRSVKSNAILLAAGLATVGVGMGQVNRVDAARLAVARAGDRAAGSVAASDAYFPFPDGLEVLIQAGVRAVVQPGGSIRDKLSIEAAEQAGITMYVTGVRHFFH